MGSETSFDSSVSDSDSYLSSGSSAPPSPTQQPSKLLSRIPFFKNISTTATNNASVQPVGDLAPTPYDLLQPSKYTGGFLSLPSLPPPVNASLPPLTHIHLAFEALPISSDDIYALATLQTLLGGGGSFSAGGPGKGMYTRLYTNVLNQYHWMYSAAAFNHAYADSGVFCINSSAHPTQLRSLAQVIIHEFAMLTGSIGKEEFERAKKQL